MVNISVDGPEDIHDAHRRFLNGRASLVLSWRLFGIICLATRGVRFLARTVPSHTAADARTQAAAAPCRTSKCKRLTSLTFPEFQIPVLRQLQLLFPLTEEDQIRGSWRCAVAHSSEGRLRRGLVGKLHLTSSALIFYASSSLGREVCPVPTPQCHDGCIKCVCTNNGFP